MIGRSQPLPVIWQQVYVHFIKCYMGELATHSSFKKELIFMKKEWKQEKLSYVIGTLYGDLFLQNNDTRDKVPSEC